MCTFGNVYYIELIKTTDTNIIVEFALTKEHWKLATGACAVEIKRPWPLFENLQYK